jgi:hypothetical protein
MYVIILYVILQTLEGYVLLPLLQRKAADVPPVVLIGAQVAMGYQLGGLGLLLAAPLTAAAMVLGEDAVRRGNTRRPDPHAEDDIKPKDVPPVPASAANRKFERPDLSPIHCAHANVALRICPVASLLLMLIAGCAQPARAQNAPTDRANVNAVNEKPNVDLPRLPSISPDGSQVVFTWRGDLWRVSSQGGFAERLTSHVADDTSSAWSRDGKRIAFASTRAGGREPLHDERGRHEHRQITNTDRSLGLVSFGTDEHNNEVLMLQAYLETDAYRSPRPYMVPPPVATSCALHDAFGSFPPRVLTASVCCSRAARRVGRDADIAGPTRAMSGCTRAPISRSND